MLVDRIMSKVPHVIRNGDPERTYPGDGYYIVILIVKHDFACSFFTV